MLFGDFSVSELIGLLVALVVGITFHEFSHAFTADALGDHRPRALGRVSLNPVRHFEPIGTVMFLIAGFGWGRPVPVNPYALRPGRVGMAWVAAAGPVANLVVALAVAVVIRALNAAGVTGSVPEVASLALLYVVFYNVVLAIFNLLPIPPLDGYNLVLPFLPARTAFSVQRYAPYGVFVLLAILVLSYGGGFGPLNWLFQAADAITGLLIGA